MTEISQRKKFELCKELSEATKEYSTEKVANEAARKHNPFDTYVGPHKAQDRWDAAVKAVNQFGVDCSQLSR